MTRAKTRVQPAEDLPTLGTTLDFLAMLWELDHAIEVTSSRMKSTLGITAQQRVIIRIVGRFPGLSAGQLARLLRLHAGTVSTALARLEARGLIARTRDPRDKRRVVLGLTPAGRAHDVPAQRTVESAVGRVLAQLHPEQIEGARTCVRALVAALHADSQAQLQSPPGSAGQPGAMPQDH